ncbi:MAG: hypothetical protein AAF416_14350 [Pseudomonadota bacterium]
MSSDYFNYSGTIPGTRTLASSAVIRGVFQAIENGFALLPSIQDLARNRTDWAGTSSGSSTAYAISSALTNVSAYEAGLRRRFEAHVTNTGAATLDVDGVGAVSLLRPNGDPLAAGEIVQGLIYTVHHNGTAFQIDVATTGQTGTVAAAGDGSVAAPGIAWDSDPDTGIYRKSSGIMGITRDGVNDLDLAKASEAEANTGTNNLTLMSPLRVAQSIATRFTAQTATLAEAIAGANAVKFMTPATFNGASPFQEVGRATPSGLSGAVEFTGIGDYAVFLLMVQLDEPDADIRIRFSEDTGATFLSGASDYTYYNGISSAARQDIPIQGNTIYAISRDGSDRAVAARVAGAHSENQWGRSASNTNPIDAIQIRPDGTTMTGTITLMGIR